MGLIIEELLTLLNPSIPVFIQTHDFPDHDAIGSAYGLASLLRIKGYFAQICYGGTIQSISLNEMISQLKIDCVLLETALTHNYPCILVDGTPTNGTIKTIAGTLVGVIDHHPIRKKFTSPLRDIRSDVGSCSAIIWSYWKDCGLSPDETTATALLSGIQLDTDFLSRKVSVLDLDAHRALYFLGNSSLSQSIVRTSLSIHQLKDLGTALSLALVKNQIILVEVPGDYSAELLSVFADFLLRLQEVSFIVAITTQSDPYRVSVRTKNPEIDAGYVLHTALKGIGAGGGHPHMAGGIINPKEYPLKNIMIQKITDAIETYRSNNETNSQTH